MKELVRFMLWNVEERRTSFDIFNCTFEPACTIEQIVKAMKKVTGLTQAVPYIIRKCIWNNSIAGSSLIWFSETHELARFACRRTSDDVGALLFFCSGLARTRERDMNLLVYGL